MNRCDEHYKILISGYLDDELEPESRLDLEAHMQNCASCRRELSVMRRLYWGTTSAFAINDVSEATWDNFLDNVYNRLERRAGWILVIAGTLCLALCGIYWFFMEPWTSAMIKVLLGAVVTGLAILFVSVLRQRLENIKTDRYSKEVHR